MEPTDNALQAGCLGNINATLDVPRRRRRTPPGRGWPTTRSRARPRASTALAAHEPEPHQFDGLEFIEVASVTKIAGGVAATWSRTTATAHVNFRYAPGRTPEEAEARLARAVRRPRRAARSSPTRRRARSPRGPLVERLIAAGGLEVAPKQAWTPVAEFARAGVPAVNFGPGRPGAGAHARRAGLASRRSSAAYGCWRLRCGAMKPSPVLSGLRPYPFARLHRGQARAAGPRRRGPRLRHRRAARGDAAVHPRRARGALQPVALPAGRGPARAARRDRALDRAALRAGARPRHRGHPHARLQGGDLLPGQVVGGDSVVGDDARLPGRRARRAVRRQRGASSSRCSPSTASCPTSTRVDVVARRAPVAQLPEQPDGRGRAAGAATSAPRRWRASTTSWSPPTRPTRRSTSAASRRPRPCRSPTARNVLALNTLSKRSAMPGYRSGLRGRRPGG